LYVPEVAYGEKGKSRGVVEICVMSAVEAEMVKRA